MRANAYPRFCAGLAALAATVPSAAQAGTFSASVVSANPLVLNGYNHSSGTFDIQVTNTGTATDAIEVNNVTPPPNYAQVNFGWVYSPTPTLPLAPGASGVIHIWLGDFVQPPPQGYPSGDYPFVVTLLSTLDGNTSTVTATVRRVIPPDPGTGQIVGQITDAQTGAPVSATVTLGDPTSNRTFNPNTSAVTAGGSFSIPAQASTYNISVDAPGYRSQFATGVALSAGQTIAKNFSLQPNGVSAGSTAPSVVADGLTALERAAFTPDLSKIAAMPGYGDKTSDSHNLSVFDGTGNILWRQPFVLEPPVRSADDVPVWTAYDNAVDMTSTGSLVAMATRGGLFAVFDASGSLLWQTGRLSDVNPQVPGFFGQGIIRGTEVRFSPDGTALAAGGLAGTVYLFDATRGTLRWSFPTSGQIRAIAFAPDGTTVYAGSGDNHLYALKAADGSKLWSAPLLFWSWDHIAVTADGSRIATAGKDGVVRVFARDGLLLWSQSFPGFINGFDYSPDGQHLIVNSAATGLLDFAPDGSVRWYRRDLNGFKIFMGPTGAFFGVPFNAATDPAGSTGLRVYQLDGTPVWTYRVPGSVNAAGGVNYRQMAFTEDGARLAVTDDHGHVTIFSHWLNVPAAPAPNVGRLVNLSVRTSAGTGDQTLTVGFVLSGSGLKPLLIRATGPALAAFGVPGTLPDPLLTLYSGSTAIGANDNWGGSSALIAAFQQVGAFSLNDPRSKDAALVTSATSGGSSYTATVADAGGGSGIALMELYDASLSADPAQPRLINLSARAQVGTGANALIAGFVISGNVPKKVLVRVDGPALGAFGVGGVLADPKLEVHTNVGGQDAVVASNDNWGDLPNDAAEMTAGFASVGAFGLNAGSKDAALILTLPAGTYTAVATGVGSTTGVALIEVYEMP